MVDIAELEAHLTSAEEPIERIDALNALAWELRNGESNAHELATEARELAIEHGYVLGQARATRTMAMTIHDMNALHRVFELAEETIELFDRADDGMGRAASRDFLATLLEHIGDLAGGLELALSALSIAKEINHPVRQAYALCNVGGILAASGEIENGIERLKEALQIFEEADEVVGISSVSGRLSAILKDNGRFDEALSYARKLRELAERQKNNFTTFESLKGIAEIEDKRGNLEEAERLYRAAIDALQTEMSRKIIGAAAKISLGNLLFRRGQLEEAERVLKEALQHCENDPIMIMTETEAHEALADVYQQRGQHTETIRHLRKEKLLREQIAKRDARNKRAQVEVRAAMDAAKKDAEIHKLRYVELHTMQSKLVEAEKMAVLGKLAAGTAHELNTPLGVLRSNTKLSQTAVERLVLLVRADEAIGDRAKRLADVLESCDETNNAAVERIAAIAQSFRSFTQLDQAELRSFDVREGLESALALLEPTMPAAVTVERRLDEVPNIEGWPREVNHAFLTVLQNAAQAIEGAGVVTTETASTREHVMVRIVDTGRGMSEDQVAHLFDVAWSKDGTRTKMRLGLSASYHTMQKHGGTITVESVLGQGTTVTFRFPMASEAEQ